MSSYAGADIVTQWLGDSRPGTAIRPNCGVLHTTETTDWPDYANGQVPHYTVKPDLAENRLVFRAHLPDEMAAGALRDLPGGVETNTLNCLQVQLVGTCRESNREVWEGLRAGTDYVHWPAAPDWALAQLAVLVADLQRRHGVPLTGPTLWLPMGPDPLRPGRQLAAKGASPARMAPQQWEDFYGWCGHQHVPENQAGDPGALAWPVVAAEAARLVQATGFGVAHVSGTWDAEERCWAEALADAASAGASVVTLTETTKDTVRAALPDGWRLTRIDEVPGDTECSVAFDAAVWQPAMPPYTFAVARTRFHGPTGDLLPARRSLVVPLTHSASGTPVVFQADHKPASVEGRSGLRASSVRARAYVESVRGNQAAWKAAQRELGPVRRVLGMDTNLNARRSWMGVFLAASWPTLRSTWTTMPTSKSGRPLGTHGNRVIDQLMVSKDLTTPRGARLLPRVPGFDHRGVVVDLRLEV